MMRTAGQPALSGRGIPDTETLRLLEREIASIRQELDAVESGIRTLEARIHSRYAAEIARIRELGCEYKKQKRAKKEKRREQKKRGVNYREPVGIRKRGDTQKEHLPKPTGDTQDQERKRLYREAVLLVHPDKFINHSPETGTRSQELTIQLIDTYQNGDIETLRHLYRHIVSGNAMAADGSRETGVPDPAAMLGYLTAKRDDLSAALNEAKQSQLHEVLTTHDDPQKFIDDLAPQLAGRIAQLERRTRIRK